MIDPTYIAQSAAWLAAWGAAGAWTRQYLAVKQLRRQQEAIRRAPVRRSTTS